MRTARALLVVVISGLLVFAGITPASAATIPVDPETRPAPVNVLPSTVAGGGRLTTGSDLVEYNARAMTMVYSYAIRNPEVVAAMKAKANATPEKPVTPRQLETIKTATKGYAVPAFKPEKLLKVVDGAGAVMTGLSLGAVVGVEGSRLFGFDPEGMLCHGDPVGNVLSFVGVLDCAMERAPEYTPNPDATGQPNYGSACIAGVGCVAVSSMSRDHRYPSQNSVCLSGGQGIASALQAGTGSLAITLNGTQTRSVSYFGTAPYPAGTGLVSWGRCYSGNMVASGAVVSSVGSYVISGSGTLAGRSPVTTVTQSSTNPERRWRTEVEGSDGRTYTAESDAFKESDDKWVTPKMPELPDGVTPGKIKIIETSPEVPPQTVVEAEPTPEFEHLKNNLADCMDGSCILDLIRNSDGKSCFQLDTACYDWAESEANRAGYTCKYGSHVVALGECSIYRDSFKSGTREDGAWYNDPSAGFEPSPVQNPNPGAGTGPRSVLQWAFQPRPEAVQEAQERIDTAAQGSFVGPLSAALGTLGAAFESGVGCGGLPFHLEGPGWQVNTMLLATCEEPARGFAAAVNGLLNVVMIGGAILAVTRYAGALFAYTGVGNQSDPNSGVRFK